MKKSQVKTAAEKISEGTIRIENGKLVGLGAGAQDSIDIAKFDALFRDISSDELTGLLMKITALTGDLGRCFHDMRCDLKEAASSLLADFSFYFFDSLIKAFNPGSNH